jgi:hypothetical protein
MKIALPDDGWAMLRAPEKVPDRLRKPISLLFAKLSQTRAAAQIAAAGVKMEESGLDPDALEIVYELDDAVILAMVSEWSFDLPITAESLDEIPGDAKDVLNTESAKHLDALMPSFAVNPDPASPTEPSSV